MRVAVVDHGMGNLRSVAKAMDGAGMSSVVTSDPGEIERCDALCVPGQGIFGRCVTNLEALGVDLLVKSWIADARPYIGICLGMQILFEKSEEGGGSAGLGILEGEVVRISGPVKVPHIGWNEVAPERAGGEPVLPVHYYFDHSYAVHPADLAAVRSWCTHGEPFAAAVQVGSATGVQFHPEKSGRAGLEFLATWARAA